MFSRPISTILLDRLNEKRRLIQALIGPRQTGKTTMARQVLAQLSFPLLPILILQQGPRACQPA